MNCPFCGSEEFYLVIEKQVSFKVESIENNKVNAGGIHDTINGKSLVCDDCGFSGWLEDLMGVF